MDKLFCVETSWKGRHAYVLENGLVRLVTLTGGGHIAEFRFADSSGLPTLNPLWIPPWKTIEPYSYRPEMHASRYGAPTSGGKLLSGIVGHNICLDFFGSPSPDEARAGLSDHGEAPNLRWRRTGLRTNGQRIALTLSVRLPAAGLELRREIRLRRGEAVVYFRETVRNERKADHFFHWVQHVTLGPPFLSSQLGSVTIPGTKGKTFPHGYEEGKALLVSNREFRWPVAPSAAGGHVDLTRPFRRQGFGFVVGVLLDTGRDVEFIAALNAQHRLLIGYCFQRRDYPWVTIWEENRAIVAVPWKGTTQARGLEFGTTPLALPRREAFASGNLFGTPTLACVPARGQKSIDYVAFLAHVPQRFDQLRDITLGKNEILVLGRHRKDLLHLSAGGLGQTSLKIRSSID